VLGLGFHVGREVRSPLARVVVEASGIIVLGFPVLGALGSISVATGLRATPTDGVNFIPYMMLLGVE
jgi:hypothetical protein